MPETLIFVAMHYTEEILKKIRQFGMLQYDIEKIVRILKPEDPEQLYVDLEDEESIPYAVYQHGFNKSPEGIDSLQCKIAQAEAEKIEMENKDHKKFIELRKELFNI